MTQKSNALRLADELDAYHTRSCHKEAAAELRRLHEENRKLKTVPMKYRRMEFNAQLQEENKRLHEVTQELLEALKIAKDQLEDWEVCIDGEWGHCRDLDELEADMALHPATRAVRAAIAKAEGQTK